LSFCLRSSWDTEKTAMREIGLDNECGDSPCRRKTGFEAAGKQVGCEGSRTLSVVLCDHRLAMLVYERIRDPKLPYQALMIRQSAKLL
jgi:hypothetical protein